MAHVLGCMPGISPAPEEQRSATVETLIQTAVVAFHDTQLKGHKKQGNSN